MRAAECAGRGALELTDELLDDDCARDIAAHIAKSQALTSISLRENEIGDEGAAAVGAAVYKNPRITSLDLARNEVTVVGAAALAAVTVRSPAPLPLRYQLGCGPSTHAPAYR